MRSTVVKRLVEGAAARLGLTVVPSWRMPSLRHAHDLAHILHQLEIDIVLDVGANVGGYRTFLRDHVGYTGRIVSFEPVASEYRSLMASAAGDPRWRGMPLALGDTDCEMNIKVSRKTTMSSFLPPNTAALTGMGYQHLMDVTEAVRTEPVAVRRLDSIIDDVLDGRSDARIFLKCDTQGFDMKVMAGAERSLKLVAALQVELSFKPIYAEAPRYDEVLERMTGGGFDVAGIYPVRRDELLRIVNFDCLMINSRHPAVTSIEQIAVVGRDPAIG
jgi:FkbM family methyltransferase